MQMQAVRYRFFVRCAWLYLLCVLQERHVTIPTLNSNNRPRHTSGTLGWSICLFSYYVYFGQPLVQPKPTPRLQSRDSQTDTNLIVPRPPVDHGSMQGEGVIAFTPASPFLSSIHQKRILPLSRNQRNDSINAIALLLLSFFLLLFLLFLTPAYKSSAPGSMSSRHTQRLVNHRISSTAL
ncbi:hypothetical protein B0T09DRAFT_158779 [Sordaria sp. MPI-SDFR-AT-0083]|nr:hypothetical protein B0T09DRAFT_158779 [Sordaria sp. MPI-SDFR-AT-0083]